MSRRTDRVADLLRKELSVILLREVSDPRIRLATLSEVSVTPNLEWARISVSVLGDEAERDACLEALGRATGFLRTLLGRRLELRTIPKLEFRLDRGAEYSLHMSQLLDELVPREDLGDAGPDSLEEE